MSSFLVVEFEEEGNPVEVVPAAWVFQNQKKCNWPTVHNAIRLTSLVIKGVSPADNNHKLKWSVVGCKVLFVTDDYNQARRAADKAADQPDIELTDTEGLLAQNSRVLRHQIHHAGNAGSAEEKLKVIRKDPIITNELRPLSDIQQQSANSDPSASHSHQRPVTEDRALISPTIFTVPPTTEITFENDFNVTELQTFRSEFHEFQKILLDRVLKLSREVEHISRIVSRVGVSSVDASGLHLPENLVFPLKDGRELAILQRWLAKQRNQSKLINFLRGIGGSSLQDCVKRMLECVLTVELQRCINWSGLNKKIAWRRHLLRNCTNAAVRTDPEAVSPTEKELDEVFIKFFGGSGDREGGRAARQYNKEANPCAPQSQ